MIFVNKVIFLFFSIILFDNVCGEFEGQYEQNRAVKLLQEYIQIDTSELKNTELAVDFWRRQANELGLPFTIYRPRELPIGVITLKGNRPELPSLMLNSHADVVPATNMANTDTDVWTYPPFSAHIENGRLYGRGTQDTKDVGIQYLEAVRKLLQNNVTLDRTIHITVVPDEEIGGERGMKAFVETEDFKSLNIGFAFDEGMTSENNDMYVTYVDKRPWQVTFMIRGDGGHGSKISNGIAMQGLQKLINRIMEFRNEQFEVMNSKNSLDYGAYTTININMVEGGVAPNVIPTNVSAVIDMRLSVEAKVNDVQNMINSWLDELNNESTIHYRRRVEYSPATAVDDSNPYWVAMQDTMKELGINVIPVVCPATSDMIVVRAKGIPALGFTTKRNMTPKLHDIDEYIDLDTFLQGIDVYVALLKKMGNLPDYRFKGKTDN